MVGGFVSVGVFAELPNKSPKLLCFYRRASSLFKTRRKPEFTDKLFCCFVVFVLRIKIQHLQHCWKEHSALCDSNCTRLVTYSNIERHGIWNIWNIWNILKKEIIVKITFHILRGEVTLLSISYAGNYRARNEKIRQYSAPWIYPCNTRWR